MHRNKNFIALVVISFIVVMCGARDKGSDARRSGDLTEWKVLFPDEEWNNFPSNELEMFSGLLSYEPKDPYPSYVQRYNPYKLGEYDVYCGSSDVLKPYIGKNVLIEGRLQTIGVEGHAFIEIWPMRIKVEQKN